MTLPIYSGLINSPLWYMTDILDTFEWNFEEKSGIFYYGSRNQIYFIKITEGSKSLKNYFDIKIQYYMKAHHDYITGLCTILNGSSLQFKDTRLQPRFASCGKDKMIRIWSFNEDSGCCCLKEFNISLTDIRNCDPTCISINSSHIILVGFDKGLLLSWNYKTDTEYKTFLTKNGDINQITFKENKFAIAHKKGFVDIYLMNSYDNITKLTQFRAHHSDLCNVKWNPIDDNIEIWGDLATSGKDRQIKLWKVEKNFNCKTIILPSTWKKQNNSDGFNEKENSTSNHSQWSSICWSSINNGSLIASNGYGNIGIWKTPSSTELKYFSQNNSTKTHCKAVFGIKEFHNNNGVFISHSLDRILNISRILTDLENSNSREGEIVFTVPCLGGSIMSVDAGERNNQLAVGGSDNLIRLWRFDSNANRRSFDVTNIWDGINGKILAIQWHPFREGLLAFGTENGDVGLINVVKDKKIAIPSKLLHQNKVFITNWGVDIRKDYSGISWEEMQDKLIVYSVGNGSLYGHNFRENEFFDLSDLVREGNNLIISDFVMHSLMRYFAVGYGNGLVNIFATKSDSELVLVCQIKTHSKGINCMRWCPISNCSSKEEVPYQLAVGSNERFLTVTDLRKVIEDFQIIDGEKSGRTAVVFNETLAKFKGHGDRITGIDWCPFDTNQLVTSSYDHTAFVWNISQNSPIVSFNNHQGKVFCCKWSPRDRDLIYTGGEDSNLFAWRPSEQILKTEFNRRRQFIPALPGVTTTTFPNRIDKDEEKEKTEDKEEKEKIEEVKEVKEVIVNRTGHSYVAKKRSSLFPITIFSLHHSLDEYQNAFLRFLQANKEGEEIISYLPCFAIFDSRSIIIKQIEIELSHHKEEKNFDNYFILLIWLGKIGRVVSDSLAMNYSADWLMSVIFGYTARDIPEELIRMHVNNTIGSRKDPILGATYWLAMSETKRAIDVLVKNDCIREAVILAKLRLPPTDRLIEEELLPKLRETYYKNGCFELSGACSMLMKNYKDVIQSLNRRKSELANWVTIQILIKHNQQELLLECAFNFVNHILLESLEKTIEIDNWREKIHLSNEIGFYSILIDLHRLIWIDLKSLKDIWSLLRENCKQIKSDKSLILCNQIKSKLITKQINQSANQLAVYLTYEILIIIIENINNKKSTLEFKQLNDLINQYIHISNMGNNLINQLIGSEYEENEFVVKMITNNLINLNLQDS